MQRRFHLPNHHATSDSGKKIDIPILITTITLVISGLVLVYDASVVQAFQDYNDKYFYIKQQLVWVILGFAALTFFSKVNHHFLKALALPLFLISFLLLLAVFIPGLGVVAGGAHRWLKLGFVSIQPAEIIKLSTIIFLASLFEKRMEVKPFLIILGVVAFIIGVLQKDLGSTIVLVATLVAIYIYSGGPIKYFTWLTPVFIIGLIGFIFSSSYRKNRVLAFLDPFSDPQGYSYHIAQVLIALGSGGIFGLGIGQSKQKYEYIPEVTTDSIFAIVGEEFGLIGALVIIFLLSYLVFKGLKIAESTKDRFSSVLAFGLTMWLGIQAAINLGAMVSLIPLTGVPLPFISYGGSALLVNLVAIGIILNISKDVDTK